MEDAAADVSEALDDHRVADVGHGVFGINGLPVAHRLKLFSLLSRGPCTLSGSVPRSASSAPGTGHPRGGLSTRVRAA